MTPDRLRMLRAPLTVQAMADAAIALLAALSPTQRGVACFRFASSERYRWAYTPGPRKGLRLKDMTFEQRAAALALFDAGLSLHGARQAREIITLETILRETERITGEISGE